MTNDQMCSHAQDSAYLDRAAGATNIFDGCRMQKVSRVGNMFISELSTEESEITPFSVGFVWYYLRMDVPWGVNLPKAILPEVLMHFFPSYKFRTGADEKRQIFDFEDTLIDRNRYVHEKVCLYGMYHAVAGEVELAKCLQVPRYERSSFYGTYDMEAFHYNRNKWGKITRNGKINDQQKVEALITHINNR